MTERRYSDEEVAAIFQLAAEQQEADLRTPVSGAVPLARSEGMTLAQLQEIGREVGIPASLVSRAAHSLDRRGRATVRRFLGLPVGVGRTVKLDRKLSQAEWERLVVDLRETFDARGQLRDEGSFRQWTNGNLQALLEPTPTGHQLRLKTIKGNALAYMTLGIGAALFAGALGIFRALTQGEGPADSVIIGLIGLAMFTIGALQLPAWARTRSKQMEEIAARLTEPAG